MRNGKNDHKTKKRFFFGKINKKIQEKQWLNCFCTFLGMMSLTPGSTLPNFVRTDQNTTNSTLYKAPFS